MASKPKTVAEKQKEEEIEKMRDAVIEQELSARSWKAFYDKMHYTIEASKIQDEYDAVAKKNADAFKAQQEKMQELLGSLGNGVKTENGEIKVKPVAEA